MLTDYNELLRKRAKASFSNSCHDSEGKFCETPGAKGHETHSSPPPPVLEMPKWPDEKQKKIDQNRKEGFLDQSRSPAYHGVELYDIETTDGPNASRSIKEAMDSITSVHALDENQPTALIQHQTEGMGAAQGVYQPDSQTIKLIDLNDQFTFVHEFGHHLTMSSSGTAAGFLTKINKQELGGVFEAITKTEAIQRITERANNDDSGYAQYLVAPQERFARAYAQYIATESSNPRLRDQFERQRSTHKANDFQWTDDDFQPVKEAFDTYFAAVHHIRASASETINEDSTYDGTSIGSLDSLYSGEAFGSLFQEKANTKLSLTKRVTAIITNLHEFYNDCHDTHDGRFCKEGGKTVRVEIATPSQKKATRTKALEKIRNAPVPTKAQVKKAREELRRAKEEGRRAGGESRGGSAAARRQQLFNLFKEFGGLTRGYVIDHQSGLKMHYTSDPVLNPRQYPTFERGKIWTKYQGGGYQLPNLLPESFDTNRSRLDRPVRKENLK